MTDQQTDSLSSRTGFKQAGSALRPHGLRVARTANCPALTGQIPAAFVAVKLKRGLRDATVQPGDVEFRADTLGQLVSTVEAAEGVKPPSPSQHVDNPTARPVTVESIQGKPDPLEATAVGAAIDLANTGGPEARTRAVEALLGILDAPVSLDPEAVKRIIREETGGQIDLAVGSTVAAIEGKIADAVKAIESAAPIRLELKLPDRESVIVVDGAHNMQATLLHELALGNGCLLVGPAGSGKTTAAEKAGEALGLTVFVQPPVADRFELLGFIDAGGTYQPSPAYRWATTKGALLILDEMDRSNPKALTAVHSMLANGLAVFPHEQIRIPEENRIIATLNTHGLGPDAEYVGSGRLDAATLNRFPARLEWDYDSGLEIRIVVAAGGDGTEAAWCQRLRAAIFSRKLRLVWSPRDTVAHCKRVAAGISRTESLGRSVLVTLKPDARRELLGGVS